MQTLIELPALEFILPLFLINPARENRGTLYHQLS